MTSDIAVLWCFSLCFCSGRLFIWPTDFGACQAKHHESV